MKKVIIMCNNTMTVYVFNYDTNIYTEDEEGFQDFLEDLSNIIDLNLSEVSYMFVNEFKLEVY